MRFGQASHRRRGLSLLEVLTALAILLLSIVAIAQMVSTAARIARDARLYTTAALLAETYLNELEAGVRPMASFGPEEILDAPEPGWTCQGIVAPENWSSVDIDGQGVAGLCAVQVIVSYQAATGEVIEFSLSRMLLDPRVRVPLPVPAAPATGNGDTGGGTAP